MGGGLGGVAMSRTGGRIASWTSSSASNGQMARMSFSSQRREVIASNVGRLLWSKRVQSCQGEEQRRDLCGRRGARLLLGRVVQL